MTEKIENEGIWEIVNKLEDLSAGDVVRIKSWQKSGYCDIDRSSLLGLKAVVESIGTYRMLPIALLFKDIENNITARNKIYCLLHHNISQDYWGYYVTLDKSSDTGVILEKLVNNVQPKIHKLPARDLKRKLENAKYNILKDIFEAGFNYLAKDSDGSIFAYRIMPKRDTKNKQWYTEDIGDTRFVRIELSMSNDNIVDIKTIICNNSWTI